MEKYLFFKTAANDSVCLPVSRLVDMSMVTDGESLIFAFIAPFGGNDGVGEYTITVTIADNKGRVVMEAVTAEIRSGKNPFITVIDDVAGTKINDNVTSCGAITDFA